MKKKMESRCNSKRFYSQKVCFSEVYAIFFERVSPTLKMVTYNSKELLFKKKKKIILILSISKLSRFCPVQLHLKTAVHFYFLLYKRRANKCNLHFCQHRRIYQ